MVDVKWTSPTDLTVSGAATYTQADLDAAVNEALERAADFCDRHAIFSVVANAPLEAVPQDTCWSHQGQSYAAAIRAMKKETGK